MAQKIDAVDLPMPPRARPMKVICLGPSRTATTSLTVALNMLGYKALHISDLLPNRLQELAVLEEAFTANATPGKKAFGRREFDKMWADYDAITESPCYLFPSVVEAYLSDPDVRFILTERSPQSFSKSLSGTLINFYSMASSFPLNLIRLFNPFMQHMYKMHHAMVMRWSQGLRPGEPWFMRTIENSYVAYLTQVKATVPANRLLVLSLEDGIDWDEMCAFLDKPVPKEPYPRLNTLREISDVAATTIEPAIRWTWIGMVSTAAAIMGLSAWRFRKMIGLDVLARSLSK